MRFSHPLHSLNKQQKRLMPSKNHGSWAYWYLYLHIIYIYKCLNSFLFVNVFTRLHSINSTYSLTIYLFLFIDASSQMRLSTKLCITNALDVFGLFTILKAFQVSGRDCCQNYTGQWDAAVAWGSCKLYGKRPWKWDAFDDIFYTFHFRF